MNKQSSSHWPVLVLLLAIFATFACEPVDPNLRDHRNPSYLSSYSTRSDYKIDPATILGGLDSGETNVFFPILSVPTAEVSLLPPDSFNWTQSDYLKIANALFQFIWNETMEGWNIYYIFFKRECRDNPHGFDSAGITYYRKNEVKGEEVYSTRLIEMYPLASEVNGGWGEDFPHPFLGSWNYIDLGRANITADEALQLAEENGGKEARIKVNNDCSILINAPYDSEDSWHVSYYIRASFEVIVDPYTGRFNVQPPPK